jgi:hypothetical protein
LSFPSLTSFQFLLEVLMSQSNRERSVIIWILLTYFDIQELSYFSIFFSFILTGSTLFCHGIRQRRWSHVSYLNPSIRQFLKKCLTIVEQTFDCIGKKGDDKNRFLIKFHSLISYETINGRKREERKTTKV